MAATAVLSGRMCNNLRLTMCKRKNREHRRRHDAVSGYTIYSRLFLGWAMQSYAEDMLLLLLWVESTGRCRFPATGEMDESGRCTHALAHNLTQTLARTPLIETDDSHLSHAHAPSKKAIEHAMLRRDDGAVMCTEHEKHRVCTALSLGCGGRTRTAGRLLHSIHSAEPHARRVVRAVSAKLVVQPQPPAAPVSGSSDGSGGGSGSDDMPFACSHARALVGVVGFVPTGQARVFSLRRRGAPTATPTSATTRPRR